MSGVARRARKSIVDMTRVFCEAAVGQYLCEVVALAAQRVRTRIAQIGIGKEVCNRTTWDCSLAELITTFEKVIPLRTMRSVWAHTAEFTIIVAVVAIST